MYKRQGFFIADAGELVHGSVYVAADGTEGVVGRRRLADGNDFAVCSTR